MAFARLSFADAWPSMEFGRRKQPSGDFAVPQGIGNLCPAMKLRAEFPSMVRRPAWSVPDKSATRELLGESAAHWRVALRAMLGQKAARG